MKQIPNIVLGILASLVLTHQAAAAQVVPPEMEIQVGFDGYCREERWCVARVVLSNEGPDIAGELRVIPGRGAPPFYARAVSLPAHSRKVYFLYFPSDDAFSRSRPKMELHSAGNVVASQELPVRWLAEDERLYGVASSDPSGLGFLRSVVPAGGRALTAQLDLASLPPDPLGWEGLDLLVLNDVDTTPLAGDQRQALETWVVHGGHLIVGGGAGASRTAAGVADLLPVVVEGTHSLDGLWALGERVGATAIAGPYAVAEAELQDGEILIQQDRAILVARRLHGAGKVDFLAFDAGLTPFTRWEDNVRLWEWMVGTETANVQPLSVQNGYSAHDAINAIPGLELPSALQILLFLLVYTVLVGPANYVVLRKLDRRELAWVTIPLLILGFSACAYVTGFQIRGRSAIVHRLAAVYVPQGAETGRVTQLVGLFSPRRTNYDVELASLGVRDLPGDYYYGGLDARSLEVFEESQGSRVDDLRVDVGGIRPLLSEGYVGTPAVEGDLHIAPSGGGALWLEGTVRNGEVPLTDAVLIVGDREQRLGDLEIGEEASVLVRFGAGAASGLTPTPVPAPYGVGGLSPGMVPLPYGGGDLPERILGPGDYWNDRALNRRYQFLQALFSYEGGLYGPSAAAPGGSGWGVSSGVHLVGWSDDQVPLPVEVSGRSFSAIESALYIYELPVQGLEPGVDVTISLGMMDREVVETTGYVEVFPEGLYMGGESEIILRFTVWPGVMVRGVDELVLDLGGAGYSQADAVPTVSLWNRRSDDWEVMDIGWGQHSISSPADYVTPSGSVLLRLQAGGEGAEVQAVGITIKGRR